MNLSEPADNLPEHGADSARIGWMRSRNPVAAHAIGRARALLKLDIELRVGPEQFAKLAEERIVSALEIGFQGGN